MSGNLHPHWRTIEDVSDVAAADTVSHGSVPDHTGETPSLSVRRASFTKSSPLTMGLAVSGFALLSLIFVQGVQYISANITADLPADVTVTISDTGFNPQSMHLNIGQIVEWTNSTQNPEKIRSKETDGTGMPFIESPLLTPGDQFRVTIREALAEMTLTIERVLSREGGVSHGTMVISGEVQAPPSEARPAAPVRTMPTVAGQSAGALAPSVPVQQTDVPGSTNPSPAVVTAPPGQSSPLPVQPVTSITPVSQSMRPEAASPVAVPMIVVPATISQPRTHAWPSTLRINTHTSSSTQPLRSIVVEDSGATRDSLHPVAPLAPPEDHPALHATAQPQTGPAVWVLLVVVSAVSGAYCFSRVRHVKEVPHC